MTQEQQQAGAQATESIRKDQYFERLALVSEEMIRDFGRDFAMGALVLAARYIAERQGARPTSQAVPQTP